eukprot:2798448-Amphidinium_carterae.1
MKYCADVTMASSKSPSSIVRRTWMARLSTCAPAGDCHYWQGCERGAQPRQRPVTALSFLHIGSVSTAFWKVL